MELEKENYRVASFVFIFTAIVTSVSLIIFKPSGQKGINIYDGFSKVLMISFALIAVALVILRYNRLVISGIALYFLIKSVTVRARLDKMVNIFIQKILWIKMEYLLELILHENIGDSRGSGHSPGR